MHRIAEVNIRKYCTVTCFYVFFLLSAMTLLGVLYDIGKYTGYVWMLTLALLELMKCFYAGKGWQRIRSRNVLQGALVISSSIVVFFVIAVLLGAEAVGQFEGTLMFSVLLSVITTTPVCLNLGARFVFDLFNNKSYEETVLSQTLIQNVCVTFLGSWLAAFVIPLDWDRSWQVWPIPCSLGALAGYFLSNFVIAVGFVKLFNRNRSGSKYKL